MKTGITTEKGGTRVNQPPRVKQKILLEKLLHGLEHILNETETLAVRNTASTTELCAIADQVTQIRLVLTDLKRISRTGYEDQNTIEGLLERFLSLEGKIKELRNDRGSARKH